MASNTPLGLGWRRIVEYLRSRRHASLQSDAEGYVHTFRAAIADLAGTSYTIPPPIVEDVRTGAYAAAFARTFRSYALIPISVGLALLAYVDASSWYYQSQRHGASLYETAWHRRFDAWDYVTTGMSFPVPYGLIAGSLIVVILNPFLGFSPVGRLKSPVEIQRRGHNLVPYLCALLIICCAGVKQRLPLREKAPLRYVEIAVSMLVRELLKAPKDKILFRRRSPRSKAIQHHVGLVAAALRKASVQVDVDPERAVTELGDMAMRICNGYVQRSWGNLLEESELAGLEPLRDREQLRLAVAGALTFATVLAGGFLGLPGMALTVLVGLVGTLSFRGLLGRTPRAMEMLDSLRGIQRP